MNRFSIYTATFNLSALVSSFPPLWGFPRMHYLNSSPSPFSSSLRLSIHCFRPFYMFRLNALFANICLKCLKLLKILKTAWKIFFENFFFSKQKRSKLITIKTFCSEKFSKSTKNWVIIIERTAVIKNKKKTFPSKSLRSIFF